MPPSVGPPQQPSTANLHHSKTPIFPPHLTTIDQCNKVVIPSYLSCLSDLDRQKVVNFGLYCRAFYTSSIISSTVVVGGCSGGNRHNANDYKSCVLTNAASYYDYQNSYSGLKNNNGQNGNFALLSQHNGFPPRDSGSGVGDVTTRTERRTITKEEGRAVLEAFEHACHAHHHQHDRTPIENGNNGLSAHHDSSEHHRAKFYDALDDCGLLPPHHLLCFSLDKTNPACSPANDEQERKRYSDLLRTAYVKKRDEERKRAHVLGMKTRNDALLSLLHRKEQQMMMEEMKRRNGNSDGCRIETVTVDVWEGKLTSSTVVAPSNTTTLCLSDKVVRNDDDAVTTREGIRKIRTEIRSFVKRYIHNIGCHPFLAGLRSLLERQLRCDGVIQWTFDGLSLTENCRSGEEAMNGDTARFTTSCYVHDSICLLLLFLVRIPTRELTNSIAYNGNEEDEFHNPLTWIVHPNLSDRNIQKILGVLPSKSELHGRATGSFVEAATATSMEGERCYRRTNTNGDLDESDLCHEMCTIL